MKKLPCNECKGLCCTYPAMSEQEFFVLQMAKPLPKNAKVIRAPGVVVFDGTCPYLENGRCSVWNARPQVCRLYGEVEQMPCAFLYPEKANKIAEDALKRMAN